ncbi:uncharacterized protein LOC130939463 [Arachis stenosperma]|uniref:uncharacterized protein LOC130939463 n=1 Tax=Arachis stenosperma TaxID=217475 RepID=UPI0025ABD159|nr:uncharacterized protein LOC130939463 [Arachis stenosperma]
MLLDPLPDVTTVLSMLTQQERQFQNSDAASNIKITYATIPSSTAGSFQGRGRGRGRGGRSQGGRSQGEKGRPQCSYCGKLGHSVDVCYKKHGLPPHLRGENAADENESFAAAMNTESESRKLSEHDNSSRSSHLERVGSDTLEFTLEQKQPLLTLLNKINGEHPHSINVTASKVSPELPHQEIAPVIIKLPNGTWTTSRIMGTIVLSNKLLLHNALYIPSFNFKLIYVSKLTSALHCQMNFTDTRCEIQDRSSMRMIGAARENGGLYILNKEALKLPKPSTQVCSVVSNNHRKDRCIWHYRISSTFLKDKSPFQILHQSLPDLMTLKVFGCLAYASTINAYRNVKFYENHFPFAQDKNNHASTLELEINKTIAPPALIPETLELDHGPSSYEHASDSSRVTEGDSTSQRENIQELARKNSQLTYSEHNVQRKSTRERKPPAYLKDFVCMSTTIDKANPNQTINDKVRYPMSTFVSYESLSALHKSYSLALTNDIESKYYEEAVLQPCWQDAINAELKALKMNKT